MNAFLNILSISIAPDVGPQGQGEQRQSHDQVAEVGQRVEREESQHSAHHVESQRHRKQHRRRPSRLKDVFALVVGAEL